MGAVTPAQAITSSSLNQVATPAGALTSASPFAGLIGGMSELPLLGGATNLAAGQAGIPKGTPGLASPQSTGPKSAAPKSVAPATPAVNSVPALGTLTKEVPGLGSAASTLSGIAGNVPGLNR